MRGTAVRLGAANAGVIESSRGRATAAPKPRRKVRRGRDFFVIITSREPSSFEMLRYSPPLEPARKTAHYWRPFPAGSGAVRADRSTRDRVPAHTSAASQP